MIPLGQFRDTFIIAVDDEGVAIIDQHVAHERVLFEQICRAADRGPAREPAAADADARSTSRRRSARRWRRTARRSTGSASRWRSSAATACGCRRCRRCSSPATCEATVRALAEDLEGFDRGSPRRGGAPAHRGDDGVPCGGEGELSADADPDALHPRRAPPHRVFERLPARPSGRAPVVAPRDREEFPPYLMRIASLAAVVSWLASVRHSHKPLIA